VTRILLRLIALLVPHAARPRWREEWLAEAGEIARVRGRLSGLRAVTGALPDAMAMRRIARRAVPGAPWHPFRGTGDDLRYAIRSLLAARGFSLPVVGSLSLGIASMIAAFTWINAIMFRPFPGVTDQDRLVRIDATSACGAPRNCASIPTRSDDYRALRDAMGTLDGLAAYAGNSVAVTIDGRAHSLRATAVSEDYFQVLGVRPLIGRTFAAGGSDDEGVVIAHSLWVREFGATPDVLGRFVTLGAAGGARIIGVAPPRFAGAAKSDFGLMGPGVEMWIPLTAARWAFAPGKISDRPSGILDDGERYFTFIGRMRPGVTVAQVASQAQVAVRAITAGRPKGRTDGNAEVTRVWFNDPVFFAATIAAILAVPALVLVIGCLNAANLLVARGARRRREMAVRTALGATRWQIGRHGHGRSADADRLPRDHLRRGHRVPERDRVRVDTRAPSQRDTPVDRPRIVAARRRRTRARPAHAGRRAGRAVARAARDRHAAHWISARAGAIGGHRARQAGDGVVRRRAGADGSRAERRVLPSTARTRGGAPGCGRRGSGAAERGLDVRPRHVRKRAHHRTARGQAARRHARRRRICRR
jgi:hypothetical protein